MFRERAVFEQQSEEALGELFIDRRVFRCEIRDRAHPRPLGKVPARFGEPRRQLHRDDFSEATLQRDVLHSELLPRKGQGFGEGFRGLLENAERLLLFGGEPCHPLEAGAV